jgi:thiamine-monophosphate kinase
MTVGATGEHALIARLAARIGTPPAWVALGIGDDAAALLPERGLLTVATTDSLIDGVHFRRAWTGPHDIGRKALAVNLSDLAAMGAEPRASLLSLALPADLPLADFDALIDGFATLAGLTKAPLVGGNIASSPGALALDVTAIGAAHRRRLLRRSGGRPGDVLFVTGALGAAATGLRILELEGAAATDDERRCVARHERPEPRLRTGVGVARSGAAVACIDLSDGLADAARQLAAASGTGVVLDAAKVPVDPAIRAWADAHGESPLDLAVVGGEDYELLFAVRPRARRRFLGAAGRNRGVPVTEIGRLTADPGAWIEHDGALRPLPEGFSHFGS